MLKLHSFTFNPFQENTYVVFNESGDCIIIDPGCYADAEKEQLVQFIGASRLRPVKLINTHCHIDHVLGNKFIAEKYRLTLEIHIKEKQLLDAAPAMGLMWGTPFENYTAGFIYLNEGDIIRLGEDELEVLLMPGHSPGSLGFYCAAQQFIISGDVLFNRSIGRTDLPGGDTETLLSSIRQKMFALPDEVKVFSGHGPATTIGEEKRQNPFLM